MTAGAIPSVVDFETNQLLEMTLTTLRLPCQPHPAENICTILKGRTPVGSFDGRNNFGTYTLNLGTLGENRPVYVQFHVPERPDNKNPADYLITLETTEKLDINRSKAETFGPKWTVPLATYGFTPETNGDWRLFIPESELSPDSCLLYITLHPIA